MSAYSPVPRLLRFASLILLALFVSCVRVDNPRVASESIKLADALNPLSENTTADKKSTLQTIYIDSSWSMSGFVGSNSSARTTFDELIDAMPDVLPGCAVYRYGQTGNVNQADVSQITTVAEFDSRLHDPNTYHLGFNPDDALIRHLVSQKKPAFSVILTDGVESDQNGQINTVVVDSIRAWLKSGNLFGILVFKSKFSGQFYSERQRKMIGNVTVDSRPFYAFVMATDRREFDDFVDKLRRRFGRLQSIIFSDDAIKSTIVLPVEGKYHYASEAPPNKPYYWQMITVEDLASEQGQKSESENTGSTNAGVTTPTETTVGYQYSFEINKSYPIKILGFRVNVKEHKWEQSEVAFKHEAVSSPSEKTTKDLRQTKKAEATVETFTLPVNDVVRATADGDYHFYAVDCSIYVKEVADDVSSISTRDDSSADNAGKTYRFQELVLAILDVHLKEQIGPRALPRLYVTASRL